MQEENINGQYERSGDNRNNMKTRKKDKIERKNLIFIKHGDSR